MLGVEELWPILLGLAIVPAVLQMALLPFCPESPRFLYIIRCQEHQAKRGERGWRELHAAFRTPSLSGLFICLKGAINPNPKDFLGVASQNPYFGLNKDGLTLKLMTYTSVSGISTLGSAYVTLNVLIKRTHLSLLQRRPEEVDGPSGRERHAGGDEGGEEEDGHGEEGFHPGAVPLSALSSAHHHLHPAAALSAAVRGQRSES